MIVRPGVLLVLVLAGAALPVAFSARRLQASQSPDLLKEIALRGETDRWREWEEGQLAKREP